MLKFDNSIRLENSVVLGLGFNDWTNKLVTMKGYFGGYSLFEDVFATFARCEDVGLLWLDSHFARASGNESR